MATVTVSAARQTLPAQLDLVEAGEEVAITRHGRVVAVLISPEKLAHRRAAQAYEQADRIDDLLTRARSEPLRKGSLSSDRAEELVFEVRASRSAR